MMGAGVFLFFVGWFGAHVTVKYKHPTRFTPYDFSGLLLMVGGLLMLASVATFLYRWMP
jgi:hypothetical protein